MGHKDHHEKANEPVAVFVATVSDTRMAESDESGKLIISMLKEENHEIAGYRILPDDPGAINELLDDLPEETRAVIFNGGTGISSRDTTYDAISARLDKTLPGFGEIFRALSYEEIGPAAIMSRATAGTMGDKMIISIPGSSGAVQLAMEEIILPELSHMCWELSR